MALNKTKKEKKKHTSWRRFTAMSKIIGLIAFTFLLIIVIYSLVEMHRTENYEPLGQLMISSFAFVTIYTGFYLNMAKAEHLEAEKSRLMEELEKIKKQCGDIDPHDEYAEKKEELEALKKKYVDIISKNNNEEY